MSMRSARTKIVARGLPLAALLLTAPTLAEPVTITILHVNDLDRMEERDGQGGFARLVAAVKQAEAEAQGPTLFTHGGDAISPSLLAGFDQGAHIIDLMNAAGIDIFVPGNHEFDFGPDVARQRFAEADFPIVASNIREPDGSVIEGAVETHLMPVGDFTFGFLGLTTPDTVELATAGDVTFADIEETAAAAAESLRGQGADLVIALAHTAIDEDLSLLRQGAVDLVLGGHDHHLMSYYDGQAAFVESASQADYLTVVTLTLERVGEAGETELVWSPSFRSINTATVEPDAGMAAQVQTYLDRLSAELDVEIGTTETALDSRRAVIRGEEAAIGNLIADATRAAVDADVAITNGGGIRADRTYEPGTVLTRRDIQSELPFGNRTVKLEVTGAAIVEALENGFSQVEEGAGRFPQVSGLSVTYDPAQPPGRRVVEVLVDGQPIDMTKTYTVATNDYMASGGDGYTAFQGAMVLIDAEAGGFMANQVIDYIEQAGTVAPTVEGRIKTLE